MQIQVKDLSLELSQKKIIQNVSLNIKGPGLIGFLGKNGAGKSTLLRCLSGINEDFSSQVSIDGKKIDEITLMNKAKTLAWSPAETQVNFDFSIFDILLMGFYPWTEKKIKKQGLKKATTLLKHFSMEDFLYQSYSPLSSGEKKIINLIRVLSTPHKLVILDEPTAFLDIDNILKVFKLLSQEAKSGKTILIATHDIREAYQSCDQIILLQKGKIQAHCYNKSKETIKKLKTCFNLSETSIEVEPNKQGLVESFFSTN